VKQHLAALRMLFDWLVIGHIIDVNPAHAVRGPKYVVKKGKTPVLTAEEARELLDSIPIVRNTAGDGEPEKLEPALGGEDFNLKVWAWPGSRIEERDGHLRSDRWRICDANSAWTRVGK
jgi:hypothetical protein